MVFMVPKDIYEVFKLHQETELKLKTLQLLLMDSDCIVEVFD